jgi:hypothetical protein
VRDPARCIICLTPTTRTVHNGEWRQPRPVCSPECEAVHRERIEAEPAPRKEPRSLELKRERVRAQILAARDRAVEAAAVARERARTVREQAARAAERVRQAVAGVRQGRR